jgi:hypothetical protein
VADFEVLREADELLSRAQALRNEGAQLVQALAKTVKLAQEELRRATAEGTQQARFITRLEQEHGTDQNLAAQTLSALAALQALDARLTQSGASLSSGRGLPFSEISAAVAEESLTEPQLPNFRVGHLAVPAERHAQDQVWESLVLDEPTFDEIFGLTREGEEGEAEPKPDAEAPRPEVPWERPEPAQPEDASS